MLNVKGKNLVQDLRAKLYPEGLMKENEITKDLNVTAFRRIACLGLLFAGIGLMLQLVFSALPRYGGAVEMGIYFFVVLDVYISERDSIRKHPRLAIYLLVGITLLLASVVYDFRQTDAPNYMIPLLFAILFPLISDVPGRVFMLLTWEALGHLAMTIAARRGEVLIGDLVLTAIGITAACFSVMYRTTVLTMNMHIAKDATHDPLTGLYNRSAINTIGTMVHGGQSGSFIMIDFDNFKHVNDAFGHQMGDAALRSLADVLREVFEPEKTGNIIFRLGGDEFAVYAVDMQDVRTVEKKLAEVERRIGEVVLDPKAGYMLSVSMGCIVNLGSWPSYEALYTAADHLLYDVKQHGKATYQISNGDYQHVVQI